MLDVPLSVFTALKKNRNKAKAQGVASYLAPYSMMDAEHPQNKITIVGNPSLGEVKTMMLGEKQFCRHQEW